MSIYHLITALAEPATNVYTLSAGRISAIVGGLISIALGWRALARSRRPVAQTDWREER